MDDDIIPDPPILSCDLKRCSVKPISKKISIDNMINFKPNSPKDLPGDAKKYISPDSFFPFDDSSSVSESQINNIPSPGKKRYDIEEDDDTIISVRDEEDEIQTLEEDEKSSLFPYKGNESVISVVKTVISEDEKRLLDNKFVALKTFVLKNKEDDFFYLILMRSYYGDSFMIEFKEKTIMGEEKVLLYECENIDSPPLIISDRMTEYIMNQHDIVTLFNDSLVYKGVIYTTCHIYLKESSEIYHPSSFKIIEESKIKNTVELAMEAHKYALEIESKYREELKESYNNVVILMTEMLDKIQDHHDIFSSVDSLIIKETDKYYDNFVAKYKGNDPIPDPEQINRITYINEANLKYIQSHFIFWNRMMERLLHAKKEFEDTVSMIYLQMKKDFPDIKGIPVDNNIDIDRSYPGKTFIKQ